MTTIQSELLMDITQTDATTSNGRLFLESEHRLANLRTHMHDTQEPFAVLAGLDPSSASWPAEATEWSARAMHELARGKTLEISFPQSFLGRMLSSTGQVLWRQASKAESLDPSLALLRDNEVLREPNGQHYLNIAGHQISALSARVFAEDRPGFGAPVQRIIDMRIKTSVDKPIHLFSRERQPDGSKLRDDESGGHWFKFPLDLVQLTLI